MGSLTDVLFHNMSAAELMIKIWGFSEHVHVNPPLDPSYCNCHHYLNLCNDAARGIWDNENFIPFHIATFRFQFCRERYFNIMTLVCHDQKKYFIGCLLRDF